MNDEDDDFCNLLPRACAEPDVAEGAAQRRGNKRKAKTKAKRKANLLPRACAEPDVAEGAATRKRNNKKGNQPGLPHPKNRTAEQKSLSCSRARERKGTLRAARLETKFMASSNSLVRQTCNKRAKRQFKSVTFRRGGHSWPSTV